MSRKTAIWLSGGSALVIYLTMITIHLSNPEMAPCGFEPQLAFTGYSLGELRYFILDMPPEFWPVYTRSLLLIDPAFAVLFGIWVWLVNRDMTPVLAIAAALACGILDVTENLAIWTEFRVMPYVTGIDIPVCELWAGGALAPAAGFTILKFGAYAVAIGLTLWNLRQRRMV